MKDVEVDPSRCGVYWGDVKGLTYCGTTEDRHDGSEPFKPHPFKPGLPKEHQALCCTRAKTASIHDSRSPFYEHPFLNSDSTIATFDVKQFRRKYCVAFEFGLGRECGVCEVCRAGHEIEHLRAENAELRELLGRYRDKDMLEALANGEL